MLSNPRTHSLYTHRHTWHKVRIQLWISLFVLILCGLGLVNHCTDAGHLASYRGDLLVYT